MNSVTASFHFLNEVEQGRVENPSNQIASWCVRDAVQYVLRNRRKVIRQMKEIYEAQTSFEIDQLEINH